MKGIRVKAEVNLADARDIAISLAERAIELGRENGRVGAEAYIRAIIGLSGALVEVACTGSPDIREVVEISKRAMDKWVELVEGSNTRG